MVELGVSIADLASCGHMAWMYWSCGGAYGCIACVMTYYDSPMLLAYYFIELSPYVTLIYFRIALRIVRVLGCVSRRVD